MCGRDVWCRGWDVQRGQRFLSLVVCISFLFLPTWLHATFALFTCVTLDVAASFPYQAEAVGSFFASDMSEQCYKLGGYHHAWAFGLGVPLLLLFCLVVPVVLFLFLWLSTRRKRLGTDSFRKNFGFLYRTWREDVCWWESVSVCQAICLVLIFWPCLGCVLPDPGNHSCSQHYRCSAVAGTGTQQPSCWCGDYVQCLGTHGNCFLCPHVPPLSEHSPCVWLHNGNGCVCAGGQRCLCAIHPMAPAAAAAMGHSEALAGPLL